MSGAFFSIELNDEGMRAAFARLQSAVGGDGLRIALGDIGEAMKTATQARAAREESPDGTPWVDLSPKYKKRKAARRPGVPKLKFDGHLLGDMFSWQRDGDDAVLVGTNAIYGATHQFGRGGIPARPFLGLSEDDKTEILDILGDHLRTALE